MNKIFAVPYNGSSDLIDGIIELGLDKFIYEFYGVDEKFMHGRILIKDPQNFIQDVKKILNLGIEFNYLLNSLNYDDYYINKNKLLLHLKTLEDIGVTILTVNHPLLVDLIKSKGFYFKINSSVNQYINSIDKAETLIKSGYDRIIIDEDELRNIKFIEKICNRIDVPIEVMVNNCCLHGCINRITHQIINNSVHPLIKKTDKFKLNWKFLAKCKKSFIDDPSAFIRASWIRPEDIERYLKCGVKLFKLTGREYPTEYIIQYLKIYSSGQHNGNVFDYIPRFIDTKNRFIDYIENSKLSDYFEHIYNDCDHDTKCPTCETLINKIFNI